MPEVTQLPVPYDLKADAANGKATISWSVDRIANQPISGYNIYLSEVHHGFAPAFWKESLGKISRFGAQPYNSTPYPGDTKGDIKHQSFILENLYNGEDYVVLIRTVGMDSKESRDSDMLYFRPLAQGTFVITPNHSSPDGGFNFENEKSMSAYDTACDVYLYATESRVGLSSPNRLTPGMRKSKFARGEYDEKRPENESEFKNDTIIISNGDVIVVKTKMGHAQLKIENIDDHYPNISARISYIYYPHIRIM